MTFETFVQSDEKTWHDQKKITKTNTKKKTMAKTKTKTFWEHLLRDLWHLRHWLQFWQLRTWIHDNLCDLTINCDTGQHSQFLRCFYQTCQFWEVCYLSLFAEQSSVMDLRGCNGSPSELSMAGPYLPSLPATRYSTMDWLNKKIPKRKLKYHCCSIW